MVDPRTVPLAKAGSARAAYLAEIARTMQFRRLLADATLLADPDGWDASMYAATRYADGRVLIAGDAGSFIDPISSAGIKKALASGWLAAVAAHTALVRPAMQAVAFDFFAAREREIYVSFKRLTERYLADAAVGQAHPFWTDRRGVFDDAPADNDEAVAAAFERIRRAPAIALRVAADVSIQPRPAVSGCEIVLEPRVVTPSAPHGVRFVRDVDVVTLLELAPHHADVGELFSACCDRGGPVALPDFLSALSTANATRWLELEVR
jgi:hypothetical protein